MQSSNHEMRRFRQFEKAVVMEAAIRNSSRERRIAWKAFHESLLVWPRDLPIWKARERLLVCPKRTLPVTSMDAELCADEAEALTFALDRAYKLAVKVDQALRDLQPRSSNTVPKRVQPDVEPLTLLR